jgi:hypothetical protein
MEHMSRTEPNTLHKGNRAKDEVKQGGKNTKQASSDRRIVDPRYTQGFDLAVQVSRGGWQFS